MENEKCVIQTEGTERRLPVDVADWAFKEISDRALSDILEQRQPDYINTMKLFETGTFPLLLLSVVCQQTEGVTHGKCYILTIIS